MKTGESESELAVYDSLISGLADHAVSSDATVGSFFGQMSQVVEAIFAPSWSAVLASGPADSPIPIHFTGVAKDKLGGLLSGSGNKKNHLANLLKRSNELGKSGLIVSPIGRPSGAGTSGPDGQAPNGKSDVWGCVFVDVGQGPVELVQSNVMLAIAETAQEFLRNEDRRQSQATEELGSQFLDFSVNAHSSLEPRVVGHHLANDARLLLGCERVSVFLLGRRSPKLLAISSVASVEGRSKLVKQMNSMVGRAARINQPIISDHRSSDQRLASLVDSHCDASGLPFVFGVPVFTRAEAKEKRSKDQPGRPIGFLLAESTSDIDRVQFARGLRQVVPHVAMSLGNANAYAQIPFRRTLGWLGRMSSFANLSRLAVSALLVGLLIAASLLVQIDFKVRIPGELRPVVERNVFAAHDGVIEKVFIDHGDKVEANQPLMQIRSTQYEVELEKASSDILKLEQLKEAKQIALNRVSSIGSDQNLAAQLASEVSDLDFQIATKQEQAKFLNQQIAELLIKCPIDGQVTTWQSKENLANRPVRWGDTVLNVAQLDGDWDLIFRVPERRIGYILKRDSELGGEQPLELEFFLESDPGKKYRVEVKKIDSSAIEDSEYGPVTILKCAAPAELENKRQGATISGDVDCGRKSVWFVWTREMFDAISRQFVW